MAKRGLAFAKSLHDNDWQCKIDEGMAGMASCAWGPTTSHIITVSDMNVRLTVWSLNDKSVQYIRNPKYDTKKGLVFSGNGKMMALIEKNEETGKDMVGLYDTTGNTWECLHHFNVEMFDVENLCFSGEGTHLIVWDSPLKCKMLVY